MKIALITSFLTVIIITNNATGQSSRVVTKSPSNGHDLYTVNDMAKIDDEKSPFTGKFITVNFDGEKISEYNYVNGKLNGEFIAWSSRGKVRYIAKKGFYRDNKKEGAYTEWDENHKVREATFKNNFLEGKNIFYKTIHDSDIIVSNSSPLILREMSRNVPILFPGIKATPAKILNSHQLCSASSDSTRYSDSMMGPRSTYESGSVNTANTGTSVPFSVSSLSDVEEERLFLQLHACLAELHSLVCLCTCLRI